MDEQASKQAMSETKHTPGPWTVERGAMIGTLSVVANAKTREEKAVAGIGTSGDGYGNARLIAAAPDLLAALQGCADALREAGKDFAIANPRAVRPNLYELHEQTARAAIAKAEGRE